MSQAAEDHVRACTHPQVKGSAWALLKAIAELIPEGETTTPPIVVEVLATRIQGNRRTVYRCRDGLERIGVLKVWDGGRGKIARYEILGLEGTRPIADAHLPLIARPALRGGRARPRLDTAPTLFDLPVRDQPGFNVGQFVTCWVRAVLKKVMNIGQFVTRWRARAKGQRSTYANLSHVQVSTCDISRDAESPHLDLDLSSSRSEVVDHARARGAPEFLTWWIATFAATVDRLRDGPLVRELLESRTFETLQDLATLFWRMPSDGVHDSDADWIARSNHSVVVFHRKIIFIEHERDRLTAVAAAPADDDVWERIYERLALKVGRHELLTWFRPLSLHQDGGEVIQVAGGELEIAWVQKHHGAVVREALEEVRPGARIEFVTEDVREQKSG